MHLQPVPIRLEPVPYILVLVVRGVVLDEDRATAAVVSRQLFQKRSIGRRIEDRVLRVVEASAPQFDCTEDLDALSLSRYWNLGRTAHATPRRMQCGVLPETGLVRENQRPVLRAGFFLS